jgi:plastocyanin
MRRRVGAVLMLALAGSGVWLLAGTARGGGTCHAAPRRFDAATTRVELEGLCYVPTVVRVQRGAEVTFLNRDSEPHTVTGVAGTWGDDTSLYRNDEVAYRFREEGVFPFACLLHPGMVGAVVVGDGGKSPAPGIASVADVEPPSAQSSAPSGDGEGSSPLLPALGAAGLVAGAAALAAGARRRAARGAPGGR